MNLKDYLKRKKMKMKDLNQVLKINYESFIYHTHMHTHMIYIFFQIFYLGSELIDFEMPELRIPFELFDETEIQYKIPDLPEISDDDKI